MGWLWTCLGGAPDFLPKLCSDKAVKCAKSHKAKASYKPHDSRQHPFPPQNSRCGYGDYDHPHLLSAPRTGRCGEPENMEAFKIPTTSVNTCISINTLKKASERSLESSFRREFGIARRSDVDDLKDEVAELRRRLASEEAEAMKLREEVSHLRSFGVVENFRDIPDQPVGQVLQCKVTFDAPGCADENEEHVETEMAPVKQFRKCVSGPMLLGLRTNTSNLCSDTGAVAARVCNDSHRAGPSPKSFSLSQGALYRQSDATCQISSHVEEELIASGAASNPIKDTPVNDLQHYPSMKVAAWTSQTFEDPEHREGTDRDLVILDSMDVHWIEVASGPGQGGCFSSTRRDVNIDLQNYAEVPLSSSQVSLTETCASVMRSRTSRGKRHLKSLSWSGTLPSDEIFKDQSLVRSDHPPGLSSGEVEAQLAQAAAAFNQQKREIELKHQSLSRGPPSSTNASASPSDPGPVIGFFRRSRKKSRILSNRGFHQRSLSPVKEALSIEETAWSSQSISSEMEPESTTQLEHSIEPKDFGSSRFCTILSKSTHDEKISDGASCGAEPPQSITHLDTHLDELGLSSFALEEDPGLAPIPCSSPSLSPRKRSASAALGTVVALEGVSKRRAERRYELIGSVDELLCAAGWEGEDDGALDHCGTPVSLLGNGSRTSYSRTIHEGLKDLSLVPASSSDFVVENRSVPNPLSVTFKPPNQELSLMSPRNLKQRSPCPLESCSHDSLEQWTSSPRMHLEISPTNERSWYCDAIDAIQSISDMRSSKERRLLTESLSLGNSPVSKEMTEPQAICPPPPQAFSAEKNALRQAFSWFLAEHDGRMKTSELKDSLPRHRSVLKNEGISHRDPSPHSERSGRQLVCPVAKTDSDSGDSGSATFSIHLNQGETQGQNVNEDVAAGARGGIKTSVMFREGVDKENAAVRVGHEPRKKISQISKQSSSPHNKHLKCPHDIVPERSILGSMPFNHRD